MEAVVLCLVGRMNKPESMHTNIDQALLWLSIVEKQWKDDDDGNRISNGHRLPIRLLLASFIADIYVIVCVSACVRACVFTFRANVSICVCVRMYKCAMGMEIWFTGCSLRICWLCTVDDVFRMATQHPGTSTISNNSPSTFISLSLSLPLTNPFCYAIVNTMNCYKLTTEST